jgi:heme exporter protein CcmD
MDLSELFAMGGYAWFVWPAYGLALVILAATWAVADWHERRLLRTRGDRQPIRGDRR